MKLHVQFYHPSTQNLFGLLKRADPRRATGAVRTLLEEISSACVPCVSFSTRPFRFGAALPPDQIVFDHEIAVDLVSLEGRPVLHIVDTHTHFQAAAVLR